MTHAAGASSPLHALELHAPAPERLEPAASREQEAVERAAASSQAACAAEAAASMPAPPLQLRALAIYALPGQPGASGLRVSPLLARRMERLAKLAAASGLTPPAPAQDVARPEPLLHAQTVADLFLQSMSGSEALPESLLHHCRKAGAVMIDSVIVPPRRQLHALTSRPYLFDAMLLEEWVPRFSPTGPVSEVLMHVLNRWMGTAGLLEGWLQPAPRGPRWNGTAMTCCYLAQLKAAKSPFHKILSRLRLTPEGIDLARQQRLEAIEKWEVVQPLLTLMPVSSPLCLERLLKAPMDQIKRVVTIAAAIVLIENRVDWAAAWEAEQHPSAIRGLAERLHPVVAMGLEDRGLKPYDILVRLVQHPLVILQNVGILPEHLQDLVPTEMRLALQYPWAFVAAVQTWPEVPRALEQHILWDAAAIVEKVWIFRRMAWEGKQLLLEVFAARGTVSFEPRFFTGAIPEPSDLTTPSTIDRERRKTDAAHLRPSVEESS